MATMGKALKVHPVASLFPEMSTAEYQALKDDIRERGLMEPIWLAKDGRIIDGRHRYKACRELKIEPTCVRNKYDDDATIAGVVVSLNLKRRHLNESQRAMVAARLKPIYAKAAEARQHQGRPKKGAKPPENLPGDTGESREKAADALNVSARSVESAARVLELATKELVHAVDTGAVAVSAAALLAKYPEAMQRKITKMLADGKAKTVKLALKAERTREQIKAIEALDSNATGEFAAVVVDPPWRYEKNREDDETQRGQTPYPSMSEAEIAALKIPAGPDCILWLWVTNAHLVTGEASRILAAWGFTPKTMLTWVKNKAGTGDWLRGKTEHAILAVRGHPVMVPPIPDTVLMADVGEHSAKPDAFYELVETHCPGEKVELFARKVREGWQQSGSELGKII